MFKKWIYYLKILHTTLTACSFFLKSLCKFSIYNFFSYPCPFELLFSCTKIISHCYFICVVDLWIKYSPYMKYPRDVLFLFFVIFTWQMLLFKWTLKHKMQTLKHRTGTGIMLPLCKAGTRISTITIFWDCLTPNPQMRKPP